MYSFSHEVRGHRYHATWKVEREDRIVVRSAYGSWDGALAGREPATVAREILERMVPRGA